MVFPMGPRQWGDINWHSSGSPTAIRAVTTTPLLYFGSVGSPTGQITWPHMVDHVYSQHWHTAPDLALACWPDLDHRLAVPTLHSCSQCAGSIEHHCSRRSQSTEHSCKCPTIFSFLFSGKLPLPWDIKIEEELIRFITLRITQREQKNQQWEWYLLVFGGAVKPYVDTKKE